MNKQFVILTGVLTLILLGVIVATSLFRVNTGDQTPSSTTFSVPTTAPIPHTSTQTTTQQDQAPLTSADLARINAVREKLPSDDSELLVDYSALLDAFYFQNTATDEAAFDAFLDSNNLRDLYNRQPSKFKKVSKNPASAIADDEQKFLTTFDDDHEDVQVATEEQKQIETLGSLFNVLLDFSIPTPMPTSSGGQQSGTPSTPQPTFTPITYSGDTTQIPCGAGRDQGVADGYKDGKLFKIRICRVQGMNINSQVSKQVDQMISTARAAGINLTGGSFRDMNGQIAIYQAWCKRDGIVGSPPPYPKAPGQTIRCPGGGAPGYSNHQMGMAIDFNCDGALIPKSYAQASQNKCFRWLQANASQYGFHELGMGKEISRSGPGYEGWHWSVNGN